jgi:hypothetical protein
MGTELVWKVIIDKFLRIYKGKAQYKLRVTPKVDKLETSHVIMSYSCSAHAVHMSASG